MEQQALIGYREAWLQAAAAFLLDEMGAKGLPHTAVRVSCGWPVSGGIARRRTVIGQCFSSSVCKDGTPRIFISPRLSDSVEVLGTPLHELVHASICCKFGHRKEFSQAARLVGLVGSPTETTVGDALRPRLQSYIERVGPYPHAAIQMTPKEKTGSRLRLYQCGCEPPVKVRVVSDGFQAVCLLWEEPFIQVMKDD